MNQKEYNGWTNYETWNVALWIGNEESASRFWNDFALEVWSNAEASDVWSREESAKFNLADDMKEYFERESRDMLERAKAETSMWADLLGAALSEVNWNEIAGSMIEDVDKTIEVEQEEND
ncbi:MAG: hypothetical protein V4563_14895 [Pseudomonadota bacterium]